MGTVATVPAVTSSAAALQAVSAHWRCVSSVDQTQRAAPGCQPIARAGRACASERRASAARRRCGNVASPPPRGWPINASRVAAAHAENSSSTHRLQRSRCHHARQAAQGDSSSAKGPDRPITMPPTLQADGSAGRRWRWRSEQSDQQQRAEPLHVGQREPQLAGEGHQQHRGHHASACDRRAPTIVPRPTPAVRSTVTTIAAVTYSAGQMPDRDLRADERDSARVEVPVPVVGPDDARSAEVFRVEIEDRSVLGPELRGVQLVGLAHAHRRRAMRAGVRRTLQSGAMSDVSKIWSARDRAPDSTARPTEIGRRSEDWMLPGERRWRSEQRSPDASLPDRPRSLASPR